MKYIIIIFLKLKKITKNGKVAAKMEKRHFMQRIKTNNTNTRVKPNS